MADKVKLSKDGNSIDFVQSDSLPTSVKKFRQSPEIEGFYRFIFENDLQKEAYEILEKIVAGRKAKKFAEKAALKAEKKEAQRLEAEKLALEKAQLKAQKNEAEKAKKEQKNAAKANLKMAKAAAKVTAKKVVAKAKPVAKPKAAAKKPAAKPKPKAKAKGKK